MWIKVFQILDEEFLSTSMQIKLELQNLEMEEAILQKILIKFR